MPRNACRNALPSPPQELEKWVVVHSPDLTSVASCSGYVLNGDQRCYFNSFNSMYSNITLCVLALTGFYFHLPPYAFLLLVHLATALRAGLMVFGTPNTDMSVDLMELLAFYGIVLILFVGVRQNDKQMRTTFFLRQQTAERLQREKERLGWDVHLITKRLEQQISARSGIELENRPGAPSCTVT